MVADRWNRFWFAPALLVRLAIFRMLVLMVAAMTIAETTGLVQDRVAAGQAAPWQPLLLLEVLHLGPPSAALAQALPALLAVLTALGVLGVATRLTCAGAALTYLYTWAVAYSFGQAHHEKIALAFALASLPLAPCGARLSLDSVLRRLRRARRGGDPLAVPTDDGLARWPLRACQLALVFGYTFAGWTKLVAVGPAWANGYTLQGILLGTDAPWASALAHNLLLCRFMSVGLLCVQASFFLVLPCPRLRWFYLPAAISFHLMAWKTMNTGPYMTLWMLLAVFLPLERVPGNLGRALREGPWLRRGLVLLSSLGVLVLVLGLLAMYTSPWLLLGLLPLAAGLLLRVWPRARVDVVFDGACGLCRRSVVVLDACDWGRRVTFLDLEDWARVHQLHPHLEREACLGAMHVISAGGRTLAGFDGVRLLAWRLPLFLPLAPLLHLPLVAPLGRRVYAFVAARRGRHPCGGGSCPVHD